MNTEEKTTSKEEYFNLIAFQTLVRFTGRPYREAMEFIDHLKYVLDYGSVVNPFGKDDDIYTRSEEGTEEFYAKKMKQAYN